MVLMPQKYNLQPHEIKVLKFLENKNAALSSELEKSLAMDQVAVARAVYGLEALGLVKSREEEKLVPKITPEGDSVLKHGLIEKRLVAEAGEKGKPLSEIKLAEKNIALGFAKRKGYAEFEGGVLKATKEGIEAAGRKDLEEILLEKAAKGAALKKEDLDALKSRKLIDYSLKTIREVSMTPEGKRAVQTLEFKEEVSRLTPEMIQSRSWKNLALRKYNVTAAVNPVFGGRRHFVNQAIDYVRRVWLDMGFKEMTGPIVNTAFWNFDALFVPQDHPARDMQDTFFFDRKGTLHDKKILNSVKKAHEKGVDGSSGWQYKWSEEEALRMLLRTHTTVLSARTLAQIKKDGLPEKYFAIGRVFRNEALDWKHLFEFNQVEGIVVDPDANFKNLLGYLKEFFAKLGFEKARFRPGYFPYTEMSIEIDVFHPERKQWIELGGAGIFRPEVVEPLLGEPIPVLAWGPGFDRIIMDYYKIKDIREKLDNLSYQTEIAQREADLEKVAEIKYGKIPELLKELAALKLPGGPAGESVRQPQNYFTGHAGRMNYKEIADRGWPSGSGAVESACRQSQCRFKRSGQFWTGRGLRALCALEDARRNFHWDDL